MVRCRENGTTLVVLLYTSIALGSLGTLIVGIHFTNIVYKNISPKHRRRSAVIATLSIITVGFLERTLRLIETWLRLDYYGHFTKDILYHVNNVLFATAVALMFYSQIETLRTCFGDSTYKVRDSTIRNVTYGGIICIGSALIWGVFNDLSIVVNNFVGRMFIAVVVCIVAISGFITCMHINYEFAWRFRTIVAQFTVDVGKELDMQPVFASANQFPPIASQTQPKRSRRNTDPGVQRESALTPADAAKSKNGSPRAIEPIPEKPDTSKSSGKRSTRIPNISLSMKPKSLGIKPVIAGPSLSLPPQSIAGSEPPPVYQTSLSASDQAAADGTRGSKRYSGMMKLSDLKYHSVSRFDETQRRFLVLVAKKTVICVSVTSCMFFICCGMVLFAFGECADTVTIVGNCLVSSAVSMLALLFCLTLKECHSDYEYVCFYCNRWTRKIVAYQTVQRVSEVYTERSTGTGPFKITVQTNNNQGSGSPST